MDSENLSFAACTWLGDVAVAGRDRRGSAGSDWVFTASESLVFLRSRGASETPPIPMEASSRYVTESSRT